MKILGYRKSSNYLTLMKAIHISAGKAAPGQIGTKFHMEPLGARRMNVCSNGPGHILRRNYALLYLIGLPTNTASSAKTMACF